jgi:hypothetical protein
MKDIGVELRRRAAWKAAVDSGRVSAYRVGDTVTVQAPNGVAITATLPAGTRSGTADFGTAYAGAVSGWTASAGSPVTLGLPSGTPTLSAAVHAKRQPATSGTPRTRVPAGVSEQVPFAPDN